MKSDIGLYSQKYVLRRLLLRIPGIERLDPNWLSLSAIVPGVLVAVCVYEGWWLWALPAVALRMIFSTADGLVAEEFKKSTPLGAFLNRLPGEFNDVLTVAALWPYAPGAWVLALVALTGWVQMFCVLGFTGGGTAQMSGPCGQTDRLALVSAGCVLAAVGHPIWVWLVPAMCAGCVITIALRISRSVRQLSAMSGGRARGAT